MPFFLFLLLLLSSTADATDYYVSPSGSGTACTQASPCSWQTGRQNTNSGDRLRFLDGIYEGVNERGFETIRSGASSSNRITWESVNPRGAKLRYVGPFATGNAQVLMLRHSNYIVRGFEIICKATNGNVARDCFQTSGWKNNQTQMSNVLVENIYVHDNGHSLYGCYLATNIEVRHSSFDLSGLNPDAHDDCFGEANYYSSSASQEPKICTVNTHHNIFARYSGNNVDMKNQTRNVKLHDNLFIDKRACGPNDNGVGDGDYITQGGAGAATNAFGNEVYDNIAYRTVATNGHFKASDGHRADFRGNVLWDWDYPASATKNFNYTTWSPSQALSYNNIHCPAADNISTGGNRHGSNTPNQINRPYSECTTRINQILGQPTISSCEIGSVSNTTLVVNFNVTKNGPISSAGTAGQLAVTYDAASQTESSITLTNDTQARITMASAPTSGQTVQVSAAAGVIKNSAFIGGMNCDMPLSTLATDPGGPDHLPNKIVDGRGVCGSNATISNFTCTNNVGTTPGVESLDQSIWRFYEVHGAEGESPLGPENSNIVVGVGSSFRWRVGVRGGGNDAPSRAYEAAARLCNPTCGNWGKVTGDYSARGITYQDDQIQEDRTLTTNQLSLGGKTFASGGVFIETVPDTPAVAIGSTQQVEWEFSFILPEDNNPLVAGNSLELRVQQGDGTPLPSYTAVPSITIGSASSGITGAFTGTIQ